MIDPSIFRLNWRFYQVAPFLRLFLCAAFVLSFHLSISSYFHLSFHPPRLSFAGFQGICASSPPLYLPFLIVVLVNSTACPLSNCALFGRFLVASSLTKSLGLYYILAPSALLYFSVLRNPHPCPPCTTVGPYLIPDRSTALSTGNRSSPPFLFPFLDISASQFSYKLGGTSPQAFSP